MQKAVEKEMKSFERRPMEKTDEIMDDIFMQHTIIAVIGRPVDANCLGHEILDQSFC